MNILLIDDEAPIRNNMKALLEKYVPESVVLGEADGVQTGLELLQQHQPDVLFLDVEMKDGTGFDLLSQYGKPAFKVIFVTGHDRYALKAFKYSAVDYLIKPVDPQELVQSLHRIGATSSPAYDQQMENLMANRKRESEDQKIVLKDLETIYLVSIRDIIRCEAQNNYTIFYLADGRKITISVTLKEYDKLFAEHSFFRSHQSHLINLSHFDRYDKKNGGIIYMKDGSTVPLANRRKDLLINKLQELH